MKMRILIAGLFIWTLSGCEKLLSPDPENFKSIEQMYTDASYAQGFLVNAYRSIPGSYDNSEYATDDAVTNQRSNGYLQMATGSWTAANNPVHIWQSAYGAILSLNLFSENVDKVKWAEDEEAAQLLNRRVKGEACGLRALFLYYSVRNHAGFTADGKLLGVPIFTDFQTKDSDFNQTRATFVDCIAQINSDLDKAEENLPYEYNNISSSAQIPERFRTITSNVETYNRVMGEYSRQLFNGLITQYFRARTALLTASPAFQDGSGSTTWADAANASAEIIKYKGGPDALPANGFTYYANAAEIDALSGGINPPEIIWRENISSINTTQEAQNFPPSLFGTGFMNPTQNLVEAFPMANGYPITDNDNSNYNPDNPFVGRDPRLAAYIIYNGSTAGVSNSIIYTGSTTGRDNGDGINIRETSTRTGYYMKKRLRMDVNVNPASTTGKAHYNPRIRYTEMYLIYAEAANEAWGPTGDGGNGFSAYDIIKAIRKRAGVGMDNGDQYLEECKNDPVSMRELIRNERRLE